MRCTFVVAVVSLLALVPGCRRWRGSSGGGGRSFARVAWAASPVGGAGFRVDAARWVRGASRVESGRAAAGPWPAAPLVAAGRLEGGAWLFAAEDGTVLRAPDFLGRLTVVGAIAGRAAGLAGGRGAVARPVSQGAVLVADAEGRLWASDGAAPRRLGVAGVVGGVCVGAREIVAVSGTGGLLRSGDGGESFVPVTGFAGGARSVALEGDAVVVETAEGRWRLGDGRVAAAGPRGAHWAEEALPEAAGGDEGPLPGRSEAVAVGPDGAVVVLRGERVEGLDARSGTPRWSVAAPGADCALARAGDGFRAVCRRAWARAVFALADGSRAWVTLRDEARGEPMGRCVFDPRSRAWAVAAPCVARTVGDPRRVCVYDDAGVSRERVLPFAAWPAAMRAGVALVVDAEAVGGEATEAVELRGDTVRRVMLPVSGEGARTLAFDGDALVAWARGADGRLVARVRGVRQGEDFAWSRAALPAGATRGTWLPDGGALVTGGDASLVAVSERGGDFRALPSPVAGDPRGAALDGELYCAGRWCRVSTGLWLTRGARAVAAPLVARAQ